MGRDETRRDETGRDGTGRDETGRDETRRDERWGWGKGSFSSTACSRLASACVADLQLYVWGRCIFYMRNLLSWLERLAQNTLNHI